MSSRIPNCTIKRLWDLFDPYSCYLQWTIVRFVWPAMIQTPWMSQSCGQRAGMLGMDSAALGWSTTSTWILMLYMETRTMVVCVTELPLCCGSGARETTNAGRLFPGVSSLELGLHAYIISYCSIISYIFYELIVYQKFWKLNQSVLIVFYYSVSFFVLHINSHH